MKTFIEAVWVGLLLGFAFGFGKDLWSWIACRYFPKFRADRTVITVDVDASKAMETLANLRASLDAVERAATRVSARPVCPPNNMV